VGETHESPLPSGERVRVRGYTDLSIYFLGM